MNKTEKILIGLALLIFCLSAVAIFGFDFIFYNDSDKEIIARVESVSKDSRVKSPDGYEYKELKVNDPITNGDNLFSGKDSKILVKFINGPKIMIGEESTIALREIDGQPDLKIEKGSFSGSFEEGDIIDVMTNNEVITLNGEKDTQFSVSHNETGKVEIGSFDKDLQVEYQGEKFTLKNEKASIANNKELIFPNRKSKSGDLIDKGKAVPKGVTVDDTPKKKEGLTLAAPYPKIQHVFLHKTGGKIPVYPKSQCLGACELEISLNGAKKIKKVFARDMIPVMYLKIEPNTEAKVNWSFSDGGDETKGSFEVLINNADNFQKALDKKLPVEILN